MQSSGEGSGAPPAPRLRTGIAPSAADLEAELQRATEQLAVIMEQLPIIPYTRRAEGPDFELSYVSLSVKAITGYEPHDFTENRRFWLARVHPDDLTRVLAGFPALFAKGYNDQQYRLRLPDGAYIWVEDRARLVRGPKGEPSRIVGAWHDITERRRLEEEFLQAQRLEAVGKLASAIAHDFNNLLMGITGCCRLALDAGDVGAGGEVWVREISAAAERGAALTRQLLAHSRRRSLALAPARLNDAIASREALFRQLLGEEVVLQTDLCASGAPVLSDPGVLDQVLMNLIVNARDAMPHGGELTLATRDRFVQPGEEEAPVPPGAWVELLIRDTGTGMDEETRARVFEPFFTTKAPGEGTGLGLPTVQGLIRQLGGRVGLDSRLGVGTTFRIFLPRVELGEREEPAGAPAAEDIAPRPRRVALIVEDERLIRISVEHYLTNLGFEVLATAEPREALELLDATGRQVDLVLSDVVLPDMSGPELYAEILERSPGALPLYMSAFPARMLEEQGRLPPGAPSLEKPFSGELLSAKVRELFGSRSAEGESLT